VLTPRAQDRRVAHVSCHTIRHDSLNVRRFQSQVEDRPA
jgi:hypothetical protein